MFSAFLRRRIPIHLELVATVLSFLAGYAVHRSRLIEYLYPGVAFLVGNPGGCSLASAYWERHFGRVYGSVRQSSKILAQTDHGLQQWETPLGRLWGPAGTDVLFAVAEQVAREYGDGVYRVRPGDVVLDCGANVGDFIREALAAGASRVIAIEPVPRLVECLRMSFASEISDGRVRVVPKGVWHEKGSLKMNVYSVSGLNSFVTFRPDLDFRRIELPLATIDQIVGDLQLDRVDFIKMDIEGAEANALRGARGTILKFKPRLSISTEHSDDQFSDVQARVQEIDVAYKRVCGPCEMKGRFQVRPRVLYFFRD